MLVLNYWGITFVLLRADFAWEFSKNMYFIGIIFPIVMTILCKTVFRRKRERKTEKTTPAAVAAPTTSPSPAAQVVSAVSISSVSPLAPIPTHDVVHAAAAAPVTPRSRRKSSAAAPPSQEETVDSPAVGVKNRVRRTRSNKAE